MCGGPDSITQTNKTVLTPEQQKLLGMGIEGIETAGPAPKMPKTQEFDPLQTQAQEGILSKAGPGGSVANAATDIASAQHFLSGDVLNIDSNPALRRAIEASTRPITEAFTGTVLPGLRTQAVSAGALGGTRDQLAEQVAAGNYERQVGDTAATVATDAYKSGLDAFTKGAAIAPLSMQAQLFPESAVDTVGSLRRDLAGSKANEGLNQYAADWNRALQLISASSGAPGGGTTGSVTPASGGGASSAASAGMSLLPLLMLLLL